MARQRRTNDDRRREHEEADRRAWSDFVSKINAVQTYVEAQALVLKGPRPDEPGRHFYSNLAFFLEHLAVPNGSNHDELQLYLQLLPRFRLEGVVKPAALQNVETALRAAIERLYPS